MAYQLVKPAVDMVVIEGFSLTHDEAKPQVNHCPVLGLFYNDEDPSPDFDFLVFFDNTAMLFSEIERSAGIKADYVNSFEVCTASEADDFAAFMLYRIKCYVDQSQERKKKAEEAKAEQDNP